MPHRLFSQLKYLSRLPGELMRAAVIILFASSSLIAAYGGAQQDFFTATVQHSTRVRIVRFGPEKTTTGAMRQHVILDSSDRKMIREVASCVTMIDPSPEEGIWTGSVLTFGVADYILDFFQGDGGILSYLMNSDLDFVAPTGAHAPQGTDLLLDYHLTPESAQSLRRIIGKLNAAPDHVPQPI